MATIGTFTEKDGKLFGKIQTLSINTSLTFLPNENQSSPEAPAYRVFAGRTEVGAAWEKTSESTGGPTIRLSSTIRTSRPRSMPAWLSRMKAGSP